MSHLRMTLDGLMESEDPVDCYSCEGIYDLRFWTLGATTMLCPECNAPRNIADVIQEARDRAAHELLGDRARLNFPLDE